MSNLQYLLVREGPSDKKKFIYLGGENMLGRGPSSSVALLSKYVSRVHCHVFWNAYHRKMMIQDNASMNGTYVNNYRLKEYEIRELQVGDYIGLGIDRDGWADVMDDEDYFLYKFTFAHGNSELENLCNYINQVAIH